MLNTAEVAARIREISGEELSTATRQVALWVEGGALSPTGPPRPGKGRGHERSYDEAGLIMAAIAAAMTRWRMSAPAIRLAISGLIAREVKPQEGVPNSGRLRQIITGDLDAFLVLQPGDRKGSTTYFFVPRPEIGEFMQSVGASNAIVFDLPELWRIATASGFKATSGDAVQAAVRDEVDAAALAAGRASLQAVRDEVESRRLDVAEKHLRSRRAALDRKASKAKADTKEGRRMRA